ncbi:MULTISPECIES: glycosyltransferase [Exiguobacterium]|uniref:glycosyltransferase n=1 Tax=Exiguobacterium TaxID=33986 RepID=UPI0008777A51|nr:MULTISPECIES: glycosyltransferase [Exiguobacterium]TCI39152.1 glycosyltransferase [Exiguobacterium sp. SH4S7]TCI48161.1 glycosyltransferase [Exiguobacterium sp. SH5S32]TCI55048.1 glycosyltransferase [Exiguobacterium sp. SH1S4]TCI63058.1 glycosyltransferase [Exiguobacterium sp. SH0S2]TCI74840.1 glycosyltransferase [Exiguobacterium sp. SH1S1]
MTTPLRVLVYGDVNLNLIDGSAIWLTSVVSMLNQDPSIQVDVLLKRSITKPEVTAGIRELPNVRFIDVFAKDSGRQDAPYYERGVLQADEAAGLIDELMTTGGYDMSFIRGFQLAYDLSQYERTMAKTWTYITDFTHDHTQASAEELARLQQIASRSARMLCQTEAMKTYFESFLPTDRPFLILNPMIPNVKDETPTFTKPNDRLVYTGKFAPLWYSTEILDAFAKLRADYPAELHVAGDKFNQDPNNPNFKRDVLARLKADDGVHWLKGIPRADVETLIDSSAIGVSWRHPELDASLELSTKLLEYGSLGKPVLLNRNPMHELILGADYPLFVNSEDEFIEKAKLALTDERVYRDAASRLYEMAQYYTFTNTYKRLHDELWGMKKINLLFAGHDFKFLRLFMDYFERHPRFNVLIDEWEGHKIHDVNHSKACLDQADIIFCEWGLGNAVWYSHHKKPHQTMIVRIHRQEKETPFPREYNLHNIDRIILVSPYMLEEMYRLFRIPRHKMTMIYNAVDGTRLIQPKQLDELTFHLGMIGVNPKLKRLDLALDMLETLRKEDTRYKLFIKGHHPNEIYWINKREDERAYYDRLLERLEEPTFKDSVVFDGHGDDVPEWLTKIGFILSTSDLESFHLAPAEAMTSGTFPIIRHWTGSETIYPDDVLMENVLDGVDIIRSFRDDSAKLLAATQDYMAYAHHHFAIETLAPKLEQLLLIELNRKH